MGGQLIKFIIPMPSVDPVFSPSERKNDFSDRNDIILKCLGCMSVTWIAFFTEWLFFDSGTLFQTGALYLLCINNFILGAYCLLLVWNILHWGRCSRCCQTVSCPRSGEPCLSNVLGRDFWQNLVLRLRFSIHFYLVYYWSILLLLIFMNQFPISHRIWFFQHFLQQVPYP